MSMTTRAKCEGRKLDGTRCSKKPQAGNRFCVTHLDQGGLSAETGVAGTEVLDAGSGNLGLMGASVVADPDWVKEWVRTHVSSGSEESRSLIEDWLRVNELGSAELISTLGEEDLPGVWPLGRKRAFMLAIDNSQERARKASRTAKRATWRGEERIQMMRRQVFCQNLHYMVFPVLMGGYSPAIRSRVGLPA